MNKGYKNTGYFWWSALEPLIFPPGTNEPGFRFPRYGISIMKISIMKISIMKIRRSWPSLSL